MLATQFKTPILFLTFNRPKETLKVLNAIKTIRPRYLFISSDGPRKDHPTDEDKCNQVRKILKNVDWPCKVSTLLHKNNLGCRLAVSTAITWFFNHVKEGIILEDDCLPENSFFPYCELLLEKYRFDERISMISGTNSLLGRVKSRDKYVFSRYFPVWGWASWRRAWKLFDISMLKWKQFRTNNTISQYYSDNSFSEYVSAEFDLYFSNKIDTWDIPWYFTCLFQSTLCILPLKNLIQNIGRSGTHTSARPSPFENYHTEPIDMTNIIHPQYVTPNIQVSHEIQKNILNICYRLPSRLKLKLKYLLEHTISKKETRR